jgi:Lamin Tail Domain
MGKKITRWVATLLPTMAIGGLLLTGTAAAQPSAPAVATGHRVQINKIYYNSPGPDTGSNSSLNHEWVRLYNTSGSNISLKGWTLHDAAGHTFTFPGYTLRAHSQVKVRTGRGSNNQDSLYWGRSWYIWNNTGDTATLSDSSGGKVDSCRYNGTSAGYTHC